MDEWCLMNELLTYATDPQIKWLDGKMEKWRANFGVQHLPSYILGTYNVILLVKIYLNHVHFHSSLN